MGAGLGVAGLSHNSESPVLGKKDEAWEGTPSHVVVGAALHWMKQAVHSLLAEGKLESANLMLLHLKELTGGLPTSATSGVPGGHPPPNQLVVGFLKIGKQIHAIKEYRAQTGTSLVEAKSVVDWYALNHLGWVQKENGSIAPPGQPLAKEAW